MKKYNVYKILAIAILVSIVLSYFIPGTSVSYGAAEKGARNPITFVDTFVDMVYNANVFMPLFIYILVIGAFYAVLYKTGRYEKLINNVAVKFNKNKGLFIVLTIFALGLVTFFTGEMYSMLLFVPFFISVIRKLGYRKETSIISTVGAMLLGNSATLYTYHINQVLSLTPKDNVLTKVILLLVSLVLLVGFILVFSKKPESTKDLKKEEKAKTLPITIIMWLIFIFIILGFVNWNAYFGFDGFDKFLETLRKAQIGKVSVFNAIVGSTTAAFGTWQLYNAAALFLFFTVLIAIICRVKINGFLEAFAEGFKKAFPYALIVFLANMLLVNAAYSGFYYTLVVGLTNKTVSLFTGSLVSVITAVICPDLANGTQFAMYASILTKAKNYQNLLAVTFQSVYNVFLLISPTSILLLLGLKYTDTRFKDWIKYIYKFFIMLLVTLLVVISVSVKGFSVGSIIALVLLVITYVLIFVI